MAIAPQRIGIGLRRFFTTDDRHPYDEVVWDRRDSRISNFRDGTVAFEQLNVEVPASWSFNATNILAQKYFRGTLGTPERETSLKQVVDRIVDTVTSWGVEGDYFSDEEETETFRAELKHLLITQKAAFNSPVWFNIGVKGVPQQGSACFILAVEDSMRSILNWYTEEGIIFKGGSGAGVNLSRIRSSAEALEGGGTASGPVSFMRGADASAGTIKSGGKTRRAAKMVILDADHPDVEEFVWCKANEEKKARVLRDAGFDMDLDGKDIHSIQYQNANNSVRATDDFMRAAQEDGEWWTKHVFSGQPKDRYKARDLLRQIAEATHQCGDPGMQFDTTVNRWHPCKNTARINASNPCSEYMFLDDSACNLSSLNLMKFVGPDGQFDVEAFRHAVDTLILAQEIIVDNASYPTEKIGGNSHRFRPLGLGFANLGALLMSMGVPYDSDQGRDMAAGVTAVMCGQAYLTSSRVAEAVGPFGGYRENEQPFLEVIRMHRDSVDRVRRTHLPAALYEGARECWDDAYQSGKRHGYRNAQVTVIAPTGTIGFMMDCDTTGIEPDLALVKFKKLVGGGVIKIVNNTVPQALIKLGYSSAQAEKIVSHIDSTGTIEGAPDLKPEHLAVFDCSFRPQNGARSIHYMGHVRMMAAVQPFISGAISKTINMPEESTVEDIVNAYTESWKLGLKAVAIYRDNSKRVQPLSSGSGKTEKKAAIAAPAAAPVVEKVVYRPVRRKLPDERRSITHKFSIGGHEGYITAGMYDDGSAGELFITMAKEGSTISGLMDAFATAISFNLQYGVPLKFLVDKFAHLRFEPSGWTGNPQVPYAKSIMDYIFRWLGAKFLGPEYAITEAGETTNLRPTEPDPQQQLPFAPVSSDAPLCAECGSIMTRNGSCYKCGNCGGTSGCS